MNTIKHNLASFGLGVALASGAMLASQYKALWDCSYREDVHQCEFVAKPVPRGAREASEVSEPPSDPIGDLIQQSERGTILKPPAYL